MVRKVKEEGRDNRLVAGLASGELLQPLHLCIMVNHEHGQGERNKECDDEESEGKCIGST